MRILCRHQIQPPCPFCEAAEKLADELSQLRRRNEVLTQALGLASTAFGSIETNADDPLVMAAEIVRVAKKLSGEWEACVKANAELGLMSVETLGKLTEAKERIRELERLLSPEPCLKDQWPVVLYFPTEADKDGFVADVERLHPNLKSRKIV